MKEQNSIEAEEVCKAVLPLADQLPDAQGLAKMLAYESVGHALMAQRRFQEALDYYTRSFNLAQTTLKETDAEMGWAYRNLALANHGLGNLGKAGELYGKAEKTLQLAYDNIGVEALKKRYQQGLKEILNYHAVLRIRRAQRRKPRKFASVWQPYPGGSRLSQMAAQARAWRISGLPSKERDAETGLDFFDARYMSSRQGRFTSPDPLGWTAWQQEDKGHQQLFADFISNPQNFNQYAYVLNNPLAANDPSGLYICTGDQTQCANVETQLAGARKSQNDNVARAAAAYGPAGVDNGVQVGFSKDVSPGKGNTGITVVNNGQTQQNRIDVTLSASQFSSDSARTSVAAGATVVHEGSHVADYQDYLVLQCGECQADITHFQSEVRAYLTGAAFFAEHGRAQVSPSVYGLPLNNPGTIVVS